MKRYLLCCAIFLLAFQSARSQEYYTGIGLRWGKFNSGITFKHFFNTDNATGLELDGYRTFIHSGGYTVKGFFIKQGSFRIPILQIPLDWIYGFGMHAGYFPYTPEENGVRIGYYKVVNGEAVPYTENVVSIGVDATLQVEYQIPMHDLPLTVSVDVNPWYEFVNRGPEYLDFGFTVRYVFK